MRDALAALLPSDPRHAPPERTGDRPKGLNVLGTLAHHPQLARAYHTFNGHILFNTSLSPRQRELLVLRVAAVRECAYEWEQHVVLAGDVGLEPDEIDRIRTGADAPGWSPLDRAMLQAVDDLMASAEVGDTAWAVLAAELDEHQLMDLIFTVGAYEVLAMALKSFRVPLDDDLLRK